MNIRDRVLTLSTTLLLVVVALPGCLSAIPNTETTPAAITDNVSIEGPDTQALDGSTPTIAEPPDNAVISSDPVSGQSGEVNLNWEVLCQSSEYQVQIAKDPDFTIIVLDTGPFAPASPASPGAYFPAGGLARSPSSVTGWSNLEAGHTYYWRARVRQAATGQHMLSPWSEVQSFTVEPGTPASSSSYGILPTYPGNGLNACPVKAISFSWTPLNDAMKYRFVLAKDAAMTEVITEAVVTDNAFNYPGQLEYSKAYFWKVMALEPAPSDWSGTFTFQTEAAPPSASAAAAVAPLPPFWAMAIIFIGLVLLIVVIILIFRMRRT
jgi:hypothetical protein